MKPRGWAHSRYVTILDQLVSSLSNFALVALVAQASASAVFGLFSLAYVVLIFFMGFQRSLVGEVLLVRFSGESRDRTAGNAAAGVSLGIGVLATVLLAILAVLLPHAGLVICLWLAVSAPFVFLQDITRYILIARGLSGRALIIDVIWSGLSIPAMVILVAVGAGAEWVVAAWMAGAILSGLVGLFLAGLTPRPVEGLRWLRGNRDIAIRFSAEYSALNLSTTVVWFLLALVVSATGVAALRGASLLYSPLNTAFNAVRIAMIPELVRVQARNIYRRRLVETGAVLLAVCVVWGAGILLLPDAAGRLLLGATWGGASGLRWPNFAQALAMVFYTALLAHFRARFLHASSSVMRATLAVVTLIAPMVMAVAWGPAGAAWGFAIAVGVAVLVAILDTGRRRRHRTDDAHEL